MKSTASQWENSLELSWSDIEAQIENLANKIEKTGFEFEKIATLTRGGLVPSRLIADKFDIKSILVDKNKIPKKTLFVDDIYDTGDTFRKIFPLVESPNKFLYATLVARKGLSYPKQLVYSKLIEGKEYVVFPWDRLEYFRKKKSPKP